MPEAQALIAAAKAEADEKLSAELSRLEALSGQPQHP